MRHCRRGTRPRPLICRLPAGRKAMSVQPRSTMKNNRTVTPAQTPAELLQDLRALVSEAEAMLGDSLKEHSAEAVEALHTRYEAAQERLAEFYAGTKKKVVAGARYTDEAIRGNLQARASALVKAALS